MSPGSPSDSLKATRQAGAERKPSDRRISIARRKRSPTKSASTVSDSSNVQTLRRICDAGDHAAFARNPSVLLYTVTTSPGCGRPSTRSIAPEKIHGCLRRTDFSRFGFKKTVVTDLNRGSCPPVVKLPNATSRFALPLIRYNSRRLAKTDQL